MGVFSNNTLMSLGLMFVLLLSGFLIGKFFDVGMEYYMPFLVWFLALCIFNIFLDKKHVNKYLKV